MVLGPSSEDVSQPLKNLNILWNLKVNYHIDNMQEISYLELENMYSIIYSMILPITFFEI
jgi:hypothetical protein